MSFLGKLSIEAVPYHEPIVMVTLAVVAVLGLVIAGLITKYKAWGPLWRDWITSIDHKRLGIMYILLALIMLMRGFADAIMMRTQLAAATNGAEGYLPPEHYDQIFTAHGVIMIDHAAERCHGDDQWQRNRNTAAVIVRGQHADDFGVDKQ